MVLAVDLEGGPAPPPARVRPPACRSSAAQSSPSCRFRSGRSRERLCRAGRGGSLVAVSGWGSYSRRRKLPEEVQATDKVQKNPSRSCSLLVTIRLLCAAPYLGLTQEMSNIFCAARHSDEREDLLPQGREPRNAHQRRRYCGRGAIGGAARSSLWRKLIRPLLKS